jgi:hypothetical protein
MCAENLPVAERHFLEVHVRIDLPLNAGVAGEATIMRAHWMITDRD